MKLIVIERTSSASGAETTHEVANGEVLVTGARVVETAEGIPHLRIEPRVAPGLTLTQSTQSGELNMTSKIGLKPKPVPSTSFFFGFEYEADTNPSKPYESFVLPKLGTGLQFNATTGAIEVTGGTVSPATTTVRGTVIIGNGINVVTTVGSTQGTISLATASASQLGGIRVGTGLSIDGSGVLSATGSLSGGTAGYLARWTSATALSIGATQDNGTEVGIGATPVTGTRLTVNGAVSAASAALTGALTAASATLNPVAGNAALTVSNGLVALNATAGTVAMGASRALHTFSGAMTEAASGTHPRLTLAEFTAPTISGAGAAVTNAATVYISAAPTVTVTGESNALWVAAGQTRLDGPLRLGGSISFTGHDQYDIGTDAVRPRDLYLSGSARVTSSVLIGSAPAGTERLRVQGDGRFSGAVYATDFVLIDGTGSVATAGPPIVVVDESTALNTTLTPLSQLTFVGAGVTATQSAAGQITVTIPGGSGGISMQSGTSTANALPKFFNSSATPTLANSTITDNGSLVTVAANLTVNGSTTLGDGSTDTIFFTGTVNSNILPTSNNSVSLGSSSFRWASTFTQSLNTVSLATTTVSESLVTGSVGGFTSGGTLTLNYANGTTYWLTRDMSFSSFAISNMPAGAVGGMTLILQHTGTSTTGGWGSVKWANNTAPTLSTTTNRYDIMSFLIANSTVFGFIAGVGHI